MARSIAVGHDRVYRAVTKVRRYVLGVLQDEVHTDIEGAYNKPGAAKARVSFWRGYLSKDAYVDGWVEESDPITWHRFGEERPEAPAPVANGRGFLSYAGGSFDTDRGHEIHVYESSSAEGPHVWLSMDGEAAHLALAQAIRLRAALNQFIEGVPKRWGRGEEMLAEAYKSAYPPVAEAESSSKE